MASETVVDSWRGSRHRRWRPRAPASGRPTLRGARRDRVVVELVTDGQSEVVGHASAGESEDGGAGESEDRGERGWRWPVDGMGERFPPA